MGQAIRIRQRGAPMIADLHAHYPMHLVPRMRGRLWHLLRSRRGRARLRDYMRALVIGFAGRVANYRTMFSGPRVRIDYMRSGDVGVVLSVLYSFFDELDTDNGETPERDYLPTLENQLATVERR